MQKQLPQSSDSQNEQFDPVKLKEQFNKMNNGNLENLPKINQYEGKKTSFVYTNQAAFLNPKSKSDGLYTDNAWDCVVVVAVSKSAFNNEVQNVGMLHLSPKAAESDKAAVDTFFKNMTKGMVGTLEITIISGQTGYLEDKGIGHAEKTFAACEKYGNIAFMNCDLHADREDRVLVDKKGTVYYEDGDCYGENRWNRKGLENRESQVNTPVGDKVKYLQIE